MSVHVRDPEVVAMVQSYAEDRRVGFDEAIKLAVTKARVVDAQTQAEGVAKIDAILAEVDSWPRSGLKADKAFMDMINGD